MLLFSWAANSFNNRRNLFLIRFFFFCCTKILSNILLEHYAIFAIFIIRIISYAIIRNSAAQTSKTNRFMKSNRCLVNQRSYRIHRLDSFCAHCNKEEFVQFAPKLFFAVIWINANKMNVSYEKIFILTILNLHVVISVFIWK